MMVTYYHEPGQPLTEEQIKRIDAAAQRPITYDDDCPESTPEMLEAMRRAVAERNRRLRKANQT